MTNSPVPAQKGGRLPPQNLQAEQAVLYCCLDSQDALTAVVAELSPEAFYHPGHKLIFKAVIDLFYLRKPVDIITVSEYLTQKGELDKAGGMTYLSRLTDLIVFSSNFREYIHIVKEKATLRSLIATLDEVNKLSYDGDQESNNILDVAIKRLSEMRESPLGGGFEVLEDILRKSFEEIRSICSGEKERVVVRTGFSKLDQATGGLRPGSLVIVAARPAMGKSALVVNMATNASVLYNTRVAFFSLEMSKEEIGNRILSSKSSVSAFKLQNASIREDDFDKIEDALSLLKNAPLYIDDRSGLTTVEMMAKCRQLKNEGGLGLVVVDYLQLMMPAHNRSQGNRQQEISEISRSLKIMAKELEVPVIALSQLSRGAEQRDEHRPILSDLRDSGAIEQDADMVMFIFRKKYYDNEPDKPEIEDAEIILAKNRQGPTKTVHLKWWPKRTLFFEDSDPNDPEPDEIYSHPYVESVSLSQDTTSQVPFESTESIDGLGNPYDLEEQHL